MQSEYHNNERGLVSLMKSGWVNEVTLIPKLSVFARLTLVPQKPAAAPAKMFRAQQFLHRSHFGLVTMEMWVRQRSQRRTAAKVGAVRAAGSEGLKLGLYLGHWDAPADRTLTCKKRDAAERRAPGRQRRGGSETYVRGQLMVPDQLKADVSAELNKRTDLSPGWNLLSPPFPFQIFGTPKEVVCCCCGVSHCP